MNNALDNIAKCLEQLCSIVKNDTINLTRDDQDFLNMKINELRATI